MFYFEGEAPSLDWDKIRATAIDVEDLDFTVTTASLLHVLKGFTLLAEFFDPLTESELHTLEEFNIEFCTHIRSSSISAEDRAKLKDQLRELMTALWSKPGVPGIICRALPNIHEADNNQKKGRKNTSVPQGW